MNANITHHSPQHSLQGPRWWWTPAGAGAVATAALVAILTTAAPGSAIPIEVDRYVGSTPAPPATSTTVRPAKIPVAEPPDLPDGWRQCFMWQARWNTALDGPQPLCPEDRDGDEGHERHQGQAGRAALVFEHAQAKWLPLP